MSRVFRSFDITKESPYNSSNIIIYGGNEHIKNYIMWLKELGFEKKYEVINNNLEKKACLKVEDFNIEYI